MPDPVITEPRFTFKVPEKARLFDADPHSVTFTALSLEQELHGNSLINAHAKKDAFEKVKLAIRAIDGVAVDWASGALDTKIKAFSPVARELILRAFSKIHLPSDEIADDFLGSMSTEL